MLRPAERISAYMEQDESEGGRDGSAVLVPLLDRGARLGLTLEAVSLVDSDPAAAICRVADEKQADLILMGWHIPLFTQSRLGGPVAAVMADATAAVGVLVDRGLNGIARVLVPYYGSPHDRAALRLAQRLNQRAGVALTIFHVATGRPAGGGQPSPVADVFRQGMQLPDRVTLKVVDPADPVPAVLAEARGGYDLVVVGVGAEWGLQQRRFGFYSEQLIRECPTSLLVLRGPAPAG